MTAKATRPRACGAKLVMPDRKNSETIIFTCNLADGHPNIIHVERGRLRTATKVQTYAIEWQDTEPEVWRQHA